MKPKNTCPLSPALISLLQACVDARCIRNQTLADHLCQSADTVHTNFRRIAGVLGTHDRFEAICMAYENGWIRFAPSLDLKHGVFLVLPPAPRGSSCLYRLLHPR